MISKLSILSDESKWRGLQRMNIRVFYAGLLGLILFFGMFYFAPDDLLYKSEFLWYFAGTVEVLCACLSLRFACLRFKHKTWGLFLFRLIFISHASFFALCCGLGIRILLVRLPLGIYSISATSTLLWGCTVAVSTFAFDFVACALYIPSMLLPIIYTGLFQMEGAVGISLTYSISLAFFLYLGRAIHGAEVDTFYKEETILKQANELSQSNAALTVSNKLFQDTVDNIDEIFLLLDLHGVCNGNPSARANSLLGFEPTGRHFTEILNLDANAKEDAESWYAILVSDRLDFEEFGAEGPKYWKNVQASVTYRVRYFAKRDAGNELSAVIMTLTDVSAQLKVEQAANEAKLKSQFILRASENPEALGNYLRESYAFFTKLENWNGADPTDLRLQLHNLKGTAAVFHIPKFVHAIDHLEQRVKKELALNSTQFNFIGSYAKEISQEIRNWLAQEEELLKHLRVFAPPETRFTSAHAEFMTKYFAQDRQSRQLLERFMVGLNSKRLEDLLAEYADHVTSVATKLGKNARLVVATGQDHFFFSDPDYIRVIKTMVHLFNNAVDHGIESPDFREAAGKPSEGRIEVRAQRNSHGLQILVQDDGGGIDPARIRRSLKQKGMNESGLSDRDVMRTIFDTGFSTKESASEVSGHGVGLSALFEEVTRLGGTLEVSSVLGKGSLFTIQLPINEGKVIFADETQKISA